MAITINWPASNGAVATAIRIYASTTKLDDDALGTPIATLPGNATSYTWSTPPTDNTVYYFRIAIDRGTDTWLGNNEPYGYFTSTGPGPQTPIRGDWELGYFGRVPTSSLLAPGALRTALGISFGSGTADASITYYNKFVRGGKILFYPADSIVTTLTFDQLYNAGLIYGTDDNGAYPAGATLTPTNQKKIITIAGFNFLARAPKGSTLPTTTLVTTATADKEKSEWDETMGKVNLSSTLPWNLSSWDDNTGIPVIAKGTITQHLFIANTATKTALHRGSGAIDSINQSATGNASYGFIPVLELQP